MALNFTFKIRSASWLMLGLTLCGTAGLANAQGSGSGTITALCSTDQPWCELAAAEFQKATGIRVLQTRKPTGEALAQLRAEASNPKTDLWWGGTGDPFLLAAEAGLLEPYRPAYINDLHSWSVRQYDFRRFEEFYDLRLILEEAAVARLCEIGERRGLDALKAVWLVPAAERIADPKRVSALDEAFHGALVAIAGNSELARCHREVTERIRIVRRLDFTRADRIQATYEEHARILDKVFQRQAEGAVSMLKAHIEHSKAEVRKITLASLQEARQRSVLQP